MRKPQLMNDPLNTPWDEFPCECCGKPWKSPLSAVECCRD